MTKQPQSKIKTKLRMLTYAIILFSLGLLFVVIGATSWSEHLHPGQLSSAHSGNITCSDCHSHYRFKPIESLHLLLTSRHKTTNSKACLCCHDLGKHPFNAHNQAKTEIQKLQAKQKKSAKQSTHFMRSLSHLVLGDDVTHRKLECSACHKEHAGNVPMLLKKGDKLCQTCHIHTFSGFHDHPEFHYYPHKRPTNIIFDHLSHIHKHFKDEKYKEYAPTQCVDCHKLCARGKMMILKPYETTCANCHNKEIIGKARAGDKGILFIGMPELDTETLKKRKINIGHWPSDATGELNPFMVIMLSENPEFIDVYQKINHLDLEDLSEATDEQLHAVAQLADIIKTFLKNLSEKGTAAIYDQIAHISNTDLRYRQSTPEIMPQDMIDALIKASKTDNEIQDKKVEPDDWLSHGGWYREGTNIFYLPRKHADDFLTSWISIAGHLRPRVKALQNEKLFRELTDPKAPGTCANCHSVVRTDHGDLKMQWQMRIPSPLRQKFTKFAHKEHLSTMGKASCESCHHLDKKADYHSGFKDLDPATFNSNFKPINKSTCQQCHTAKNNNDGCLLCHEYHVGEFNPKVDLSE